MMRLLLVSSVCLLLVAPAPAADPAFEAVAPLLKTYCVSCHSGDKPKGDLDLAKLAPDFAQNGAAWKGVYDRLADGSMPPKGKPRPAADAQKAILTWVHAGLTAQQSARAAADGRARLRRLNRV